MFAPDLAVPAPPPAVKILDDQGRAKLLNNIDGQLLDSRFAPGGELRPRYTQGIVDVTTLLWRAKRGAVAGQFSADKAVSPELRYFPSMLAIQLLLEDDKIIHDESAYFDEIAALTDDALVRLCQRLYINDAGLGSQLAWDDAIQAQVRYPHVYTLLRGMVLTARQTRDKVCITRDVEKRALDTLLENPQVVAELTKHEAALVALTAGKRAEMLGRIAPSTDPVLDYINGTLYDLFFNLIAPPAPLLAPGDIVPFEEPEYPDDF